MLLNIINFSNKCYRVVTLEPHTAVFSLNNRLRRELIRNHIVKRSKLWNKYIIFGNRNMKQSWYIFRWFYNIFTFDSGFIEALLEVFHFSFQVLYKASNKGISNFYYIFRFQISVFWVPPRGTLKPSPNVSEKRRRGDSNFGLSKHKTSSAASVVKEKVNELSQPPPYL